MIKTMIMLIAIVVVTIKMMVMMMMICADCRRMTTYRSALTWCSRNS